MADFIKCLTCVKSWDKYCTVTLKQLLSAALWKPRWHSRAFYNQNCEGRLCKIHWS